MPNRLAGETSPYLLQHQHNPVDWHPWGPEALALARQQDKPIFLSVGYAACHWCHVMERESFENEAIARLLNDHFISIKVDREERPDVDQIYMQAVQMLTGRGGWPMSVFLTPDGEPFFGGTYWPPTARGGMPGFDQILAAVVEAWRDRREAALDHARQLTEHVAAAAALRGASGPVDGALLSCAGEALHQAFDPTHGGFGGAPKFPHPIELRLLVRLARRFQRDDLLQMAVFSLEKMAAGGIRDHLGGGFHRYSVDERWLVPHFEKMLYDNALLASAYLDAWRATGREDFAQIVRETLDFTLRELTDAEGGFYGTLDADSEGHEGKYYVWTPAEIEEALGAQRAELFGRIYDVSAAGNFEGTNILHLSRPIASYASALGREANDLEREVAEMRETLLEARGKRIRPALDDKVIVAWNGLMIEALAAAGGALDEPRYLAAARKAADFLLDRLRAPDGRLLHSYRGGVARLAAYLDDYACLAHGLLTLYENTFVEKYVDAARSLADELLARFSDEADGGFYYTASDGETLVARARDVQDGATPSGNAMAATALLRLSALVGDDRYRQAAEGTLRAFSAFMRQAPLATGQMLIALERYLEPSRQAVVLGDAGSPELGDALSELRRQPLPPMVVACRDMSDGAAYRSPALDPLFAGKTSLGAGPTLYLCENFACQRPVAGAEAIRETWRWLAAK